MANEIKITAALECSNGNFQIPRLGSTQLQVNQNAPGGGVPGMVSAATAGSDITTTGVSTLGWCYVRNLDATNFVEWGPKDTGTFYPIGRLKPGEATVFRLSPGKTLHIKADTAACKCQVLVLED